MSFLDEVEKPQKHTYLYSIDLFFPLFSLKHFLKDVSLQGLWNVFDSYWTHANQSGEPDYDSLATDLPDSSPPSIGDEARRSVAAPSGSVSISGPAVEATPPVAPASVDPYHDSRPFSAYDVVMLDDESGELVEPDLEPDSEPIPSNVPGPALRSCACMDPASKEKRRREIQDQIASLRSGWGWGTTPIKISNAICLCLSLLVLKTSKNNTVPRMALESLKSEAPKEPKSYFDHLSGFYIFSFPKVDG